MSTELNFPDFTPLRQLQPAAPRGLAYEKVAAAQTAQVMGTTGAQGDYIRGLWIVPATTSPGVVTLLDGAVSIPILTAGTLADLKPFFVPLDLTSVDGPWKITTGNNVSVLAIGQFTA